MRTVAVTGGIGSGKSTVCAILSRRGIPVYDSDSAAKNLYERDDSLLDAIEGAFGCGIRSLDGSFDKEKLATVAFSSRERLRTLESIVHPAVLSDFKRWNAMQSARFADDSLSSAIFFGKEPFCVLESAIILDKQEFMAVADKVVLVDASLTLRLRRACDRDHALPEKIIARMAVQHFDLSKVDVFIRNDGTLSRLASETEKVFARLKF